MSLSPQKFSDVGPDNEAQDNSACVVIQNLAHVCCACTCCMSLAMKYTTAFVNCFTFLLELCTCSFATALKAFAISPGQN